LLTLLLITTAQRHARDFLFRWGALSSWGSAFTTRRTIALPWKGWPHLWRREKHRLPLNLIDAGSTIWRWLQWAKGWLSDLFLLLWDFRLQDDCGLACGDYVSPFYLCAFACVLGIRKHACAYGWFHQGFVLSLKENDVQLEVSW